MTAPDVAVRPAGAATQMVVIILPGGSVDSFAPFAARGLAGLRVMPIARAIHRAGRRHGITVWTMRYRYRGWNGEEMSPVADTQWALDEVRRRHGDEMPVVLVGHSMGGRVAIRVSGDASVRAVVGLAPWLPDGEPVEQLRGCELLVVHGTLDTITSPTASRRFVDDARQAGAADARFVPVRGDTHAMLRSRRWNALTTSFVLAHAKASAT